MLNTKEMTDTTFLRDRMNSICPVNFFHSTDTTDTTIWKPGFRPVVNLSHATKLVLSVGNEVLPRPAVMQSMNK